MNQRSSTDCQYGGGVDLGVDVSRPEKVGGVTGKV